MVDFESWDAALLKRITTGAALHIEGKLIASQGKGQTVELKAEKIDILGDCDPEVFPLQPKKHSLEFLREIAHLRFRTNTFSAISRVKKQTLFYGIQAFLMIVILSMCTLLSLQVVMPKAQERCFK